MDTVDMSQGTEDAFRAKALAEVVARKPVPATGHCLWCHESIPADAVNQRFCDTDHRDEYDRFLNRHPELKKGNRYA